ncbi:alpha-glucan family phosphorylase [Jatrophihabitans lederbergiae]|uniref:glycogen phosphorylase n=1 Tax=Jatrophihabitans lederbergiae TaxID=3075547 RepID=A0ABU2J4C4_9ACTN|nr:alpha-glucan family phosphorylase [Jatrophihabitans sp. DSM 44399]MDT0259833.1 alpha-glucan family phosphorylase [Jatrophihabitans sp. DSM 44399]
MKALRRLTVRAALPAALAPLGEIVANLRWSWHADSLDLLESIDPELWAECNGDPARLLGGVSTERLAALAKDRKFLRRLQDVSDDLRDYLEQPRWYQRQQELEAAKPANEASSLPSSVAYFSPEFGIAEVLPQYSGGLGILAGDHLKAASDLGAPIIGVGLLYRAGYFSQSLSREGWQQERYPSLDPQGLPLTPLRDVAGNLARVLLELPDQRALHAQIWLASVGRVPLLLLDSDVEENDAAARGVTDRLYGGGPEHRLLQELLLGVGGVRALRVYCSITGHPEPEVFHSNEGHAGFLGIERISELSSGPAKLSFAEALTAVRAGTVFTTHTPVPAGIDRFDRDLVAAHLGKVPGVPVAEVLALGAEDDPTKFNMAHMGLRLGQRANGVAQLHGRVSRSMFNNLWPGFDADEVPITSITNGVHAPTWMAREFLDLAEQAIGSEALATGGGWAAIDQVEDTELWSTKRELRARLVGEIRRRIRQSGVERGFSGVELAWTATAFDPDVLTIGFARRVPSYKRLTLMLRDPARLKRLLTDPDRPVQIVVAGKSHPADDGGKELIAQLVRFTDDPEVRGRIAFLPDYDIGMARYLYWGSDVWLNNPLRPLEACGTSGMKAALNGGLNLSIKDGWWDEWCEDGKNGWEIPSADDSLTGTTDDHRDAVEAAAMYDLIEHQVSQRFYSRDARGIPTQWIAMVRYTLKSLGPKVLATRMVQDYIRKLYAPAARSAAVLVADDFAAAKDLAAWKSWVAGAWKDVAVRHVESHVEGDPTLGGFLQLRAEVALSGLKSSDVQVQALYGPVDADNRLTSVQIVPLTMADERDHTGFFTGDVPLKKAGPFGYTVRVLPHNDLLANPAETGLVAAATQG